MDQYDVWSAWGSEDAKKWESPRKWTWARSGVIEPIWDPSEGWPWSNGNGERLSLRDRRAVGMGIRMLVRKGDKRVSVSFLMLFCDGLTTSMRSGGGFHV